MKWRRIFERKRAFVMLLLASTVLFMATTPLEEPSIPKAIEKEAKTALSYYPELKKLPIEFKFKDTIKKSTMQAQPKFRRLFKPKNQRGYVILINDKIRIGNKEIRTRDLPSDVLIGWFGHELGHIKDYQHRSALNLLFFGIRYLLSSNYIKGAERRADSIAVAKGIGPYILKTKAFILENADVPEPYKNRILEFYPSPEEIMHMIDELEAGESK